MRAAVQYLLKESSASDRGDIVREIIEIVSEVARGLAEDRPAVVLQFIIFEQSVSYAPAKEQAIGPVALSDTAANDRAL